MEIFNQKNEIDFFPGYFESFQHSSGSSFKIAQENVILKKSECFVGAMKNMPKITLIRNGPGVF